MTEEQEMFLSGGEGGEVFIVCRRKGCMIQWSETRKPHLVWLQIEVPYEATPLDVDRIWMQHRIEHANRER